jgi:hypothetical protein
MKARAVGKWRSRVDACAVTLSDKYLAPRNPHQTGAIRGALTALFDSAVSIAEDTGGLTSDIGGKGRMTFRINMINAVCGESYAASYDLFHHRKRHRFGAEPNAVSELVGKVEDFVT